MWKRSEAAKEPFSYRIEENTFFPVSIVKLELAAYNLWQNICKALLLQKDICDGVHSYHNSYFKMR